MPNSMLFRGDSKKKSQGSQKACPFLLHIHHVSKDPCCPYNVVFFGAIFCQNFQPIVIVTNQTAPLPHFLVHQQ